MMSDTNLTLGGLPLPKAWPFDEAARIAAQVAASGKELALFETGYGPSGLPHIGTFGEVARTSWVRHAYTVLTGKPTRLLAFSDDMDGLRKVPENVPNREMLAGYLNQPLTRVPDPFGTHASFGEHNNARLRSFLDGFGFDYEFASSTEYYREGRFDAALMRVAELHAEIVAIISPTLGAERRATYSPFLPLHPHGGQVMQVKIEHVDAAAGTLAWTDPATGERFETPIRGGACKLQWKADWAMRWFALGVDYEMSGKDLIDSVKLSGKVCRALGAPPPVGYTYELFLDENSQKISKSKGNGLSVEQWLEYAPAESLSQYMYNSPQRAKRLFFDVIPRAVDEFIANAAKLERQNDEAKYVNPAWHITGGRNQDFASPVPFSMLLNLASVVNAETPDMLWGFLRRYSLDAAPGKSAFVDGMVDRAIAYYRDVVRPQKQFRVASEMERGALEDLAAVLAALPAGSDAEAIQNAVYEVGKRHPFADLKAWFGCLYQVLLGQAEGPRFGGFVALYGIEETVALIEKTLATNRTAADAA